MFAPGLLTMRALLVAIFMLLGFAAMAQLTGDGVRPSNALVRRAQDTYYSYYSKRDTNDLFYVYRYHLSSGDLRLTQAEFEAVGSFWNGRAPVKQHGKYGYIDTTGKLVIPYQFDEAFSYSDSVAIVFKDCKYGILDIQGHITPVDTDYTHVLAFTDGYARVSQRGLMGLIDKQGKELLRPSYNFISPMKNGYAYIIDTTDKQGLIDKNGKVIFAPQFDDVLDYVVRGNVSIMLQDSIGYKHYGLGNVKGQILIPLKYSVIRPTYPPDDKADETYLITCYNQLELGFSNRVFDRNKIDWKHYVAPPTFIGRSTYDVYTSTGKLLWTDANKYRFIDYKTIYVEDSVKSAIVYADGTVKPIVYNIYKGTEAVKAATLCEARFMDTRKLGLLNQEAEFVIPPVYDSLTYYYYNNKEYAIRVMAYKQDSVVVYDSLCHKEVAIKADKLIGLFFKPDDKENKYELTYYLIKQGSKYGVFSKEFRPLLPAVYDTVFYNYSVLVAEENGLSTIYSSKLEKLGSLPYKLQMTYYKNGWFTVLNGDKKGFCSTSGTMLVPPVYTDVEYSDGFFMVRTRNRVGVYDTLGKVIFKPEYKSIAYKYRLFVARKGRKYWLYNAQGSLVSPNWYNNINLDEFTYGYIEVKKHGKTGFLYNNGQPAIPIAYSNLTYINRQTTIRATKHGKQGIISKNNEVIIPFKYSKVYQMNGDTYMAQKGEKHGLLDAKGNVLIPLQYHRISELSWRKGLYTVSVIRRKKEYFGVVNTQGQTIINFDYEKNDIDYEDETIIVTKDGKRYFYNTQGQPVTNCYLEKH